MVSYVYYTYNTIFFIIYMEELLKQYSTQHCTGGFKLFYTILPLILNYLDQLNDEAWGSNIYFAINNCYF